MHYACICPVETNSLSVACFKFLLEIDEINSNTYYMYLRREVGTRQEKDHLLSTNSILNNYTKPFPCSVSYRAHNWR